MDPFILSKQKLYKQSHTFTILYTTSNCSDKLTMPIHGQKSLHPVLYKTTIFSLTSIYWISDWSWNHIGIRDTVTNKTVSALKTKGREAVMHRWQVISFNQNSYVLKTRNSFLSFLYASNQVFNKGYVYKNRRKRVSDQSKLYTSFWFCKAVSHIFLDVRLKVSFAGMKAGSEYVTEPPCLLCECLWWCYQVLWWILHGWHCIITEMG